MPGLRGSRVGGVPTDEGVFGTGPLNEGIVGVLVRAAAAGRDSSAPAGFQSVSVEARGAVTAQVYTLQRLCVDAVLRADDGTTYSSLTSRAAVTNQAYTLQRLLVDSAIRGDNGSNYAAIGAVLAVAAQSYGLVRLLGDSVIRGDDGTTYSAIASRAAVTAQAYTLQRLCVDGVVRGDDGATYSAVASRAAITGQSNALVRLLTDSSIRGQDPVTGTYQPGYVELPSAISGRGTSAVFALYTAAIATGIDNTGAAVLRPVEARDFSAVSDVTLAIIGLSVNSRGAIYNTSGADWNAHAGDQLTAGAINDTAAYVLEGRESAYVGTSRSRRFSFTHQTPGTLITAQATFAATTPTLILYNSAGNTTTIILRTVRVSVLEATTAPVFISVAIDTADRFSAAGTVITGQNWNEASAVAYPGTAFRFNATASAAGAGTRYLWTDAIPTGIGASITISFKDGIIVNGVGSILVYLWDSAGANGADIVEDVEVEAF
jgi:hypothetical protein